MTLSGFSPNETTMPASMNIQNPPLAMDTQDPDPLAKSLVLDFLVRNSFNDIASEFKKISGTHENLETHHGGLKLEQLMLDLMDDLFAKSIVYDFLRRTAHAKIAIEFKLLYGPFKDLNGFTLEELFGSYNKKYKVISTNPIPSTSQTLSKSSKKVSSNKPEIISVPSASHVVILSNKKVNSLVYDFLVRKYHFDVASDFKKLVGSLEDVRGGPLLEDMFIHYMQSKISNAKVIADKEKYLKIVKLNDEYHDHIQNFQPKTDSQLDQVVLYLTLQNLRSYNLNVKLRWRLVADNPNDYPWMNMRHFSNCKDGEVEMIMRNYETLISKSRVNNPTKFCDETLELLSTGKGKKISENVKWKLIMIGVFLSKGLTKVRHAFDVLIRVMDDVKSQTLVKGRYSIEEDNIIKETVQKYGNNEETWKKLCIELKRASEHSIKSRYEKYLITNIVKVPNRFWSIEEDKHLIDCLFKNSSLKNSSDILNISKNIVIDSKADEKINRHIHAIAGHWVNILRPLLLQYHQGTVNTPWKYFVLQYIYENEIESATELGKHVTEINKYFPWLDVISISACYRGNTDYNTKTPLHEIAKTLMEKYKGKPAHTELELKRCEEIIEHYDPAGELSEYKFCKIHEKCLKSDGCGSL